MLMKGGSRMSLDVLSPGGLDYSNSFIADSPCGSKLTTKCEKITYKLFH